jgi:hypothetical protein
VCVMRVHAANMPGPSLDADGTPRVRHAEWCIQRALPLTPMGLGVKYDRYSQSGQEASKIKEVFAPSSVL